MSDAPDRSGSAAAARGLLVVAIDRLPAWILPAYGATWVAMPRLTALAARGVVLDRMIATGDDPSATLCDLLGGPSGPDGSAGPPVVAAAVGRGWRTAFVTDDPSALVAGADVTRVIAAATGLPGRDAGATCLARLGAAAREVVAAGTHRLVIVHVTSLGICWDAPEAFRDAYVAPDDPPPPPGAAVPDFEVSADADPDLLVGIRQAYAGQLTLLDACLGEVFDAPSGWSVVVAGLRGLALGLHGRVGPGGASPHGEIVHVPAIVRDAAGRMAGQRHAGIVIPADVGATLVELVGGPAVVADPAAPWCGASLAGLLAAWTSAWRDRAVSVTSGGVAVVTDYWHAFTDGIRVRLYAKPDDYFELCDVADRCPAVAEELGGLARAAHGGDVAAAWRTPLAEAATRPG